MEVVSPAGSARQRRWPKHLGLGQSTVDPDSWVTVVRDCVIDRRDANGSTEADRLVDALAATGIQAQQRLYKTTVWRKQRGYSMTGITEINGATTTETRVAVVIHARDQDRGVETARAFVKIETSRQDFSSRAAMDELTRLALEQDPESS